MAAGLSRVQGKNERALRQQTQAAWGFVLLLVGLSVVGIFAWESNELLKGPPPISHTIVQTLCGIHMSEGDCSERAPEIKLQARWTRVAPRSGKLTWPVAGSQMMAEASLPSCPVATKRPHGETARLATRPEWPAKSTCEWEA